MSGSGLYCGDGYNQTLPENVQLAVCNKDIQLKPFLYSIYWPDGSWDFTSFELLAQQSLASNQSSNMCTSNSSTTTTSGTATGTKTGTSPTQTSTGASGKVDTVAVVSGTLGAALGLVLVGVIVAVLYIRKRRSRHKPDTQPMYASPNAISPFLGQPRGQRSTEQLSHAAKTANSESNLISQASYLLPTAMVDESPVDDYPARARNNLRRKEKASRPQGGTNHARPDIRERDGGISMQDSQLPPDYRTVCSG